MGKTFYNDKKYVYYISLNPNKTFAFDSYNDEDGDERCIVNRTDKHGNEYKRDFKWDRRGSRYIKIPASQTDVIEFLDNSPHCAGSPNQSGTPRYKKVDTGGDAEKVLDDNQLRIKAENIALNELKDEKLRQVAIMLGDFDEDSRMQRLTAVQAAGKNPKKFMDIYESADLDAMSTMEIAIKNGVLHTKGSIVMWGKEKIGVDREEAVATLMKENSVLKGIKKELSNLQVKA